jgi:hypothetical protein
MQGNIGRMRPLHRSETIMTRAFSPATTHGECVSVGARGRAQERLHGVGGERAREQKPYL